MSGWTLTLRQDCPLRLDLRELTPAALTGRSAAEVERWHLWHGNESLALGEVFAVSPHDGEELVFEGDLSRADRIGWQLAAGVIRVEGPAGDYLGAGMSGMAGRSAQVVRGDFVRGNADAGLELFVDMLIHPDFPEEELALVRHDMLAALDEQDDVPELIAAERLWARLYPSHPYGAPAGGTRGTLGRMGVPALRELHARWLRADNLVVTVAGGFDPDLMLRKIRRWLGRLPGGWKAPAVVSPPPPPETVRVRVGSDREQAHVMVAWPGARVAGPEQPVVELAAGVLGGQGGRLFLQLREEHGLAYSVGAHGEDGWDSGLFVGGIATDPERIDEAQARLIATVQALAEAEVPAEELERARASQLGGIEAELQATSSRAALAALTELYGSDGTAYRALARARVEEVTAAQIRSWAAGALVRPLAIARVEPR
jgi:zinc protease